MQNLVVLCLTCAVLAGQYQLGLRRKKLAGLLLPLFVTAVFAVLSLLARTLALLPIGLACVAAIAAIWCIGYANAASYGKKDIRQIRSKKR